MLKRTGRLLLFLTLCVVMVLSINAVAFASGPLTEPLPPTEPLIDPDDTGNLTSSVTVNSPGGAREATEEQMKRWADVEKPNATGALSNSVTKGILAYWEPLSPFYYYGQELGMSCGPASVRMALKYLTGTTYSEATIRNGCNFDPVTGTFLADLVDYTNDEQDENFYLAKYGQTKATMNSNLYNGITIWDAPPIIGVEESINAGWPYDIGGHFLAVYSVMSDKSEYALCDPWAGFIDDDDNRWYDKSDDDLYSAYDAVNIGYMY
ncbi:MAG: hypothetical protein NTY03_10185 [Candidatus Bathyarchaeota archaeon]|nr:hypothetical protein [Candidatus Bathyarchaeota archaeon]